jgi:integrase/recombinase XerD
MSEQPPQLADEQQDEIGTRERAEQPALFEVRRGGKFQPGVAAVPSLAIDSPLQVAIHWYRRHLEQGGHTRNTVESYCYDLAIFEGQTATKRIDKITPRDVARFLGDSEKRSTRKRRLTSLSGFFRYLVGSAKMLTVDPTENFYPDPIPLKTPRPLFAAEQEQLLAAAAADSARTHAAIWLMLRLGIGRSELLGLRTDHVDRSDPERPVVYIYYENPRWANKERHFATDAEFAAIYEKFLEEYAPDGKLFPILPQSVNKIVERVVAAAGLGRTDVTPQTLRDTYAVEKARQGADESQLLILLGLADDPRNRLSVSRYVKLAADPL